MTEPDHGRHPHQAGPWEAFRGELRASTRQGLRELPRAILEGLAEVAIVMLWFALCIVGGGLVGRLVAGESGIMPGGLIGLLVAALGIVVFYVVTFFAAGVFGLRGLLRRRRSHAADARYRRLCHKMSQLFGRRAHKVFHGNRLWREDVEAYGWKPFRELA